ncbi:mutT/nudix family protein [Aquipluma nitroreducens]|uniref:MutT/nudix family protein n=1 Tax=Aquipluma nitroreducens TaxID=2010828 RepID=A0A5K7SD92_9BACT|nr:NUDIX hydrolase [Aquipluma nitroreducens]BBE19538.1 mutT/nudix family protein [Aquipluma nitroreducens]
MERSFFEQIKRLLALAEIGLAYSDNNYDIERYEEIQEICLDMLGQLTDVPITKIKAIIQENNGYKTPKVDVRAVVFNPEGQILLVQEKADGCWALPGGWADVGYTPRMIAEKECFEEAGLAVKSNKLIAVMDKTAQQMPPEFEYVYKLFIRCEPMDTQIAAGAETDDVGWFNENELPELSKPRNIESQIYLMFEYFRGEKSEVYLD